VISLGRIIAVANQKGGVGKTTTNINLSACLAQMGKKVLTVDIDPQGNTSSGLGVDKNRARNTIYEALIGECYLQEALVRTRVENLDVLPANIQLAGAEIELIDFEDREYLLKRILYDVRFIYDFIIIDCPPSLNMLTINAMTAADSVLVPIQCEYYALEGLTQLLHTIGLVQKKLNPDLVVEGVVFTMFDARTNLSIQVVEEVKKHLGKSVYRSVIPRNVRLSEAPSHGVPITLYDSKSKGSESYMLLAEEVLLREAEV
jgi:chromosome partitioning protein